MNIRLCLSLTILSLTLASAGCMMSHPEPSPPAWADQEKQKQQRNNHAKGDGRHHAQRSSDNEQPKPKKQNDTTEQSREQANHQHASRRQDNNNNNNNNNKTTPDRLVTDSPETSAPTQRVSDAARPPLSLDAPGVNPTPTPPPTAELPLAPGNADSQNTTANPACVPAVKIPLGHEPRQATAVRLPTTSEHANQTDKQTPASLNLADTQTPGVSQPSVEPIRITWRDKTQGISSRKPSPTAPIRGGENKTEAAIDSAKPPSVTPISLSGALAEEHPPVPADQQEAPDWFANSDEPFIAVQSPGETIRILSRRAAAQLIRNNPVDGLTAVPLSVAEAEQLLADLEDDNAHTITLADWLEDNTQPDAEGKAKAAELITVRVQRDAIRDRVYRVILGERQAQSANE